ncbi:MAG: hypothetical protein U5K79_14000 [Cyclobacteriaceae bacterium]|nr:hypothetical protein [Cyclobacteriaceae bacterium]
MNFPDFQITSKWIRSQRGPKNAVDPNKPYGFLVEKERLMTGEVADVATIFLTNRECPFHCLMCDLWKNTTDTTVAGGSIPEQIEFALTHLPPVKHIKLYNSGNFFDKKAIPPSDFPAIIGLLRGFDTVLVENHPKLITREVLDFRDKIQGNLQVAIGLETAQSEVLKMLNKSMTLEDFSNSCVFLTDHEIPVRTFILLRPPFLDEQEGIFWAKRSLDFAFDAGVECCVVIPTRAGNGALDALEKKHLFHSPQLSSLEEVQSYGISQNRGRVFADLWDLEQFSTCPHCFQQRCDRMHQMNLEQMPIPKASCRVCNSI